MISGGAQGGHSQPGKHAKNNQPRTGLESKKGKPLRWGRGDSFSKESHMLNQLKEHKDGAPEVAGIHMKGAGAWIGQ